ncbi:MULTISPECIES: relaxase/mobilization nuclease domain-containing protein [unclassified Pannonibacter]|uniref:relaxase/mobilization nuclease domain-containing protein n=1 Tax=unclassified Pannonibacter TaxID=2627228 RepID=UPI001644F466|nr:MULTISPECIES: hypothetical protein [unclassified Pannonibacter]
MIAGVGRHARTRRESHALVSHLLKEENSPRVRILGGTLAVDLPTAVRDMERLRDSSKADAAALHIFLSPSREMTDDELVRAGEIVIDHLGAADHPAALVVHDKERLSGEGHRHVHLVLGRVSPEGRVLPSGFEKIRLETAAHLIEHELGEEPTLGRHHKSAVRWLRNNGRADVADWLEAAHGPDPDKPTSAASPEKRQALSRKGIDLSSARAAIRDAWTSGGVEAVRSAGYEIEPGRKSGIFIVARDGVEIGSLDRLTGQKRADIRIAMEAAQDQISRKDSESETYQPLKKPVESVPEVSVGDPSSEKSATFRPSRSGAGHSRDPLYGRKRSGAELVSEAAGEQAQAFAADFRAHLDDRLAVAAAHRWIEDRRTSLKGAILESSRSPDDADAHARREVARSRRELAVLAAAETALRADPTLAFGGEKALIGVARRLHAEQAATTKDEIRTAWESGGVAGIRAAGYEIAPGRDGAWRVLREGAPIGTLHTLADERRADMQSVMTSEISPDAAVSVQVPATPLAAAPRSRSPEATFKAATGFLDRLETRLNARIADLARPDTLADPAELIDTRRRLSSAASALAAWEAQYASRISALREVTSDGRPEGWIALLSGRAARYKVASRELSGLYAEREPLLRPVAKMRREVRILETTQASRQAVHDDTRRRELARLKDELTLLPDARAALSADPAIAQGGGKALADAARKRQAERRAEEQRRELAEVRREQSAPAPGRY